MLVDCMFSQQYWSPIKSENCCLDNLNPNSVIGRTVNQFKTPLRVDISTKRFSLSFISVLNLLMIFLYFCSSASWSQFWVSLEYLRLYRTEDFLNWRSKFWCAFAGVNKFNFHCFMKYWNGKSTVPGWLRDWCSFLVTAYVASFYSWDKLLSNLSF